MGASEETRAGPVLHIRACHSRSSFLSGARGRVLSRSQGSLARRTLPVPEQVRERGTVRDGSPGNPRLARDPFAVPPAPALARSLRSYLPSAARMTAAASGAAVPPPSGV